MSAQLNISKKNVLKDNIFLLSKQHRFSVKIVLLIICPLLLRDAIKWKLIIGYCRTQSCSVNGTRYCEKNKINTIILTIGYWTRNVH